MGMARSGASGGAGNARAAACGPRACARRIAWPWLLATIAMVCLIWGNSLVPGEGSSGISLAVMHAIRDALSLAGIPSGWVTNFLVRKCAHFTEYAVLGALASQALGPWLARDRRAYLALALFLVAVPSIDETIQLSVAGRAGQVPDVILDCCGAATGSFLRWAAARRAASRPR